MRNPEAVSRAFGAQKKRIGHPGFRTPGSPLFALNLERDALRGDWRVRAMSDGRSVASHTLWGYHRIE